MLMSLFLTLAGLVGSGAGIWIAALFFPHLALLLKAAIDFLRSPLGQWLAVAGLALALFTGGWIGGDVHGTSATRAEWRADNDAKAKAEAAREAALKTKMVAHADEAIAADDTFTKSIDQQVQNHDAKNADAAVCRRATRDDIGRLLSIH